MKSILIAICCLSVTLLIAGILGFAYLDETKPYVDAYANHVGILAFFVSVVGFVLTVWTVFETLRVSVRAEKEIQKAVADGRTETKALLTKIRTRLVEDTCDHALLFATEARYAIRSGAWLRAAERCDDARQLAARLLTFPDLSGAESGAIRAIVEDLRITIAFIERYKLNKKKDAAPGMPEEKRQPVDSLIDEMEKLRSRLQNQILEVSDVDGKTN